MASGEQANTAFGFSNTLLWTNDDMTVLVLDVPGSIKDAQGPNMSRTPISREALGGRLQDYEPRSAKTREAMRNDQRDSAWHQVIAQEAETALKEASSHMQGRAWCLVRSSNTNPTRSAHKRVRDEPDSASAKSTFSPIASKLPGLLALLKQNEARIRHQEGSRPDDAPIIDTVHIVNYPTGHYGWNHGCQLGEFGIKDEQQDTQEFYVPESSAFLVCPCQEPILFHRFVRESSVGLQRTSDRFDVILLDPPWPNLSAGRKGSYVLSSDYDTVQELLLDLPLSRYCTANGYIAMWITNNARVRNMTHELGGLFEQWGATLVEEWVWVKVTKDGDPILALDGIVKKPYEVLLVAQNQRGKAQGQTGNIRRRYLFGVPDLHSRKPCLKAMFDACLSGSNQTCCVLEVFARHLVQGWSSWGNEALQYNWKRHWT